MRKRYYVYTLFFGCVANFVLAEIEAKWISLGMHWQWPLRLRSAVGLDFSVFLFFHLIANLPRILLALAGGTLIGIFGRSGSIAPAGTIRLATLFSIGLSFFLLPMMPRVWMMVAFDYLISFPIPILVAWLMTRSIKPIQNKCTNCSYDLTGNVSGTCPECGESCASMNDMEKQASSST